MFRSARCLWAVRRALVLGLALGAGSVGAFAAGQDAAGSAPKRIHLVLKDGSFQVVTRYKVVGTVVQYVSAERGGATEEVPLSLVDLEATHRWEQRHRSAEPAVAGEDGQQTSPAAPIAPELLKEEADRAALTPEVAPDLSLPRQDGLLVLDTFQGTPELVPMPQSSGDLNRTTGHSTLRNVLNPRAASHALTTLRGERAVVQLHVSQPTMYVRLGDENFTPTGGGAPLTVDTHGATGNAPSAITGGSASSRYAVVRMDVRVGARVLDSFPLEETRPPENVAWMQTELLPGGHWLKLTARSSLSFGEYALVEVLSNREVNLNVWDFGIHPVAPENRDAYKPEPRRRVGLEQRRPE